MMDWEGPHAGYVRLAHGSPGYCLSSAGFSTEKDSAVMNDPDLKGFICLMKLSELIEDSPASPSADPEAQSQRTPA